MNLDTSKSAGMSAASPLSARKITIAVETLGCRLNLFESDGILTGLIDTGLYETTSIEEAPDLVIINTCTVTGQADARNRHAIRSAIRKNPASRIIVTGCYAQTDREEILKIPGVDLVVGNDRKSQLPVIIQDLKEKKSDRLSHSENSIRSSHLPSLELPFAYGLALPQGHTRAYLKIQDGCDRKCSYCKIPQARGRGTSRAADDILEHVKKLQDHGVPEIVMTGVNLGWYRDRDNKVSFADLIRGILPLLKTTRLRLSSIEPCDVDRELAELTLHPAFCNFLHVPLQSGSAQILKKMRRTYNPVSFRKRLELVKKINPQIFLGTDVIVGFPGESNIDFQETAGLCSDLEFANIHSFRFAARAGTPAASFRNDISQTEIRGRMTRIHEIREESWHRYATANLGLPLRSVIENSPDDSKMHFSLSDNFLKLAVDKSLLHGKAGDSVCLVPEQILENRTILSRPA